MTQPRMTKGERIFITATVIVALVVTNTVPLRGGPELQKVLPIIGNGSISLLISLYILIRLTKGCIGWIKKWRRDYKNKIRNNKQS